jgi:septum formation protein
MASTIHLYLASQSPRRRELLKQVGVKFRVLVPDVDEEILPREAPTAYVERIARLKAEVTWSRLVARGRILRPVLAADTAVILGRRIFGKPADNTDARAILHALSGRTHQVVTAVAVRYEKKIKLLTSTTAVTFRRLAADEIARYIASSEPRDKAGAYAIQGLAATLIARIEGSYSGVMGLPLFETARLLKTFGIQTL